MARIEILEGGVEAHLSGNVTHVLRINEKNETVASDYEILNRTELLELHNKLVMAVNPRYGKILRSFKDKATAMKRTKAVVDSYLLLEDEILETEKVADTPERRAGRRGKFADSDIIRVNVSNPKREGTREHFYYSKFKDGMTVGEYRAMEERHRDVEIGGRPLLKGWPSAELAGSVRLGQVSVEKS